MPPASVMDAYTAAWVNSGAFSSTWAGKLANKRMEGGASVYWPAVPAFTGSGFGGAGVGLSKGVTVKEDVHVDEDEVMGGIDIRNGRVHGEDASEVDGVDLRNGVVDGEGDPEMGGIKITVEEVE
ncbi:hypothetical protein LTR78_007810 [Recurvomyces mirabilis]|uniref:Uncharacterized protein n=1 Tax=Recurvomyces mirabilis TaxID=574656 RepID=A0AAE0WHY0_9PEZI|nr:hypothetical protein LTR78_007810 [Recurvomyces mirabilis]KAK5160148.1 hypothetical protein LTS14_002255 [Recurvomyces mirabilis]